MDFRGFTQRLQPQNLRNAESNILSTDDLALFSQFLQDVEFSTPFPPGADPFPALQPPNLLTCSYAAPIDLMTPVPYAINISCPTLPTVMPSIDPLYTSHSLQSITPHLPRSPHFQKVLPIQIPDSFQQRPVDTNPTPISSIPLSEFSESYSQQSAKRRKQLSQEEKKANHIASEKKRRQGIKEAFDTLMDIVPNNNASGHANSKSMQLLKATEYIKALKRKSSRYSAMLQKLRAEMGGKPSSKSAHPLDILNASLKNTDETILLRPAIEISAGIARSASMESKTVDQEMSAE